MQADSKPWYRQPWVWFLIALPMTAVVGGLVTMYIAATTSDGLVVDDYYKAGLAINQEKHRLASADRMGMSGLLRSDGKQLTLSLTSQPAVTEKTLSLNITHSTRAELDRELTLQRLPDGGYATDMPVLPAGTWYLRLQANDASWQIWARMRIDGPFQARLAPSH